MSHFVDIWVVCMCPKPYLVGPAHTHTHTQRPLRLAYLFYFSVTRFPSVISFLSPMLTQIEQPISAISGDVNIKLFDCRLTNFA